jgi:phosphatidylglycerol lysyltransferase
MSERIRRVLPSLVGLVLFVVALEVLRGELRTLTWHRLSAGVLGVAPWRLVLAVLFTALNYAVMTGYDFLAFEYLGKRLPWQLVTAVSFLAYAIANNVGFAMLSGASVRYRFYTRWGITAEELSRIVFSYVVTFWLGLLLLGGLSLVATRVPGTLGVSTPALVPIVGWLLMAASVAYVVAACFRRGPIRIYRLQLPLPSPRIAAMQLGLSILDWLLAGLVLYVLLPTGSVPFLALVGAFLAAQLLGLASHVPGGVGVFEGVMVLLLRPFISSTLLLPGLIAYRAVYYLLPLSVAVLLLVGDELRQRRPQVARLGVTFGWLSENIAPRLLSVFTFLSGVVLLFSGATPATAGRLHVLERVLPLGVVEVSHFAGSILGAALLLLSQGLARRLDLAYFLTVAALAAGIATSLLKGVDYEEAAFLAVVLIVLWRARLAFDRRAALFDTRFASGWTVAVVAAIGASIWLGFFAFKHVEYSNELWWQFEFSGEASRMLRASVGSAVTLLLFGFARVVSRAPHEAAEPTSADLEAVAPAIAAQTSTFPYLVYLRDKSVLFDEQQSGFVMYGVRGRTWVALGDPVGPSDRIEPLIRLFLQRCDDFGGVPVFYEILSEHLHSYIDVGFTFVKLGEEARVDLTAFSLEGGRASRFRQAVKRLEKDQATFRIVSRDEVPGMIDQLRSVSDEWLGRRAGAEKGFSLGSFKPDYLSRFPVAVIEAGGHVVAFANIWPGPGNVEISLDLMRFSHDAPRSAMEALFVHTLTWGKAQGYRWFSLGMAPLSGFETSPVAPFWNRLAAFLYEHGEALYNFQGLRAYKEKFDPVWQPRYLAYPGGLHLARALADASALVAGGYRRIFLK